MDYVNWLFSCSPKWAKAGFRFMVKDSKIIKKALSIVVCFFIVISMLLYVCLTNSFHVAVRLVSNRSQMTSKYVCVLGIVSNRLATRNIHRNWGSRLPFSCRLVPPASSDHVPLPRSSVSNSFSALPSVSLLL